MSRPVLDSVVAHLVRESEVGGYAAADEASATLSSMRLLAARLVGSRDPSEVALMDSASRAWAMCFYSVPVRAGQTILLTGAEYASNAIAALHRAAATGAEVEFVRQRPDGGVDLDDLASKLRTRDVPLLSLVHVPTNGGLVNDVAAAAALGRDAGAFVLLDACQSVGQIDIDVRALPVDALSATGRKWLRGPRGTGFLWVRKHSLPRLVPVMLDLGGATWTAPGRYELRDSAQRLEFWEGNVAGFVGLERAVSEALSRGLPEIEAAVRRRADRLRDALAGVRGVAAHDPARHACGIVSFSVEGVPAVEVKASLEQQKVTVSVSRRPVHAGGHGSPASRGGGVGFSALLRQQRRPRPRRLGRRFALPLTPRELTPAAPPARPVRALAAKRSAAAEKAAAGPGPCPARAPAARRPRTHLEPVAG
jgi:cysteine desulfurase